MKSAEELNSAISDILKNIEQLNKSYTPGAKMHKAGEEYDEEQLDPNQDMGEGAEGENLEQEGGAPAQGEEMGGEDEDEMGMEEYLSQMSEEELQGLLAACQQEIEARAGAGAAEGEGEGEEMGDQGSLQKSVSSLKKTIQQLNAKVEKLEKNNSSSAKHAVAAAKKKHSSSRVAASNNLEVLEKSKQQQPVERLSKSETLEFLQGQIRKDPNVNSTLVWQCNKIPDGDSKTLKKFQDSLNKKGIKLPQV